METKHSLTNPDGSHMPMVSVEPLGATAEKCVEYSHTETDKAAGAQMLVADGKTVIGFIVRSDTSSLHYASAACVEAVLHNSNVKIALRT
ncbi:hypothetical protein [Burkholderia sp. Tr-20390]|uniref:hypothetical protein n=1 Tax=Burkholderia sp. Tr-20390 TaxID=2703904 RepID=UPI00197FA141|nr:hypothetical protein [Burkholderia sp. Tr-20390]MBN3729326.1 hypothetical protein [Burkholderia sp. Tr-20390]